MQNQKDEISQALALIFEGIKKLQDACNYGRKFTIDGRLVGDIGELIAAREFDIVLDSKSRKDHDAKTADGRDVQIKATFQDSLTFRRVGDLYLGLKILSGGQHEVIYNGPSQLIAKTYSHRKGIGVDLLSFPIVKLKQLSEGVDKSDRIPVRKGK